MSQYNHKRIYKNMGTDDFKESFDNILTALKYTGGWCGYKGLRCSSHVDGITQFNRIFNIDFISYTDNKYTLKFTAQFDGDTDDLYQLKNSLNTYGYSKEELEEYDWQGDKNQISNDIIDCFKDYLYQDSSGWYLEDKAFTGNNNMFEIVDIKQIGEADVDINNIGNNLTIDFFIDIEIQLKDTNKE